MNQRGAASAAAPEENMLIRYATLLAAALCGLVAAYALVRYWKTHVGHDQAYELYAAAEILRGVKLNGPELVEVNPPFLLWFMSLPVLLAKGLHLDLLNGFRVFFAGLAFGISVWTGLLFRRLAPARSLLLWVFFSMVGVAGGVRILYDDLGQREHIVIFLLLPYMFVAAFRMERRRLPLAEVCAIGLLAAVAICLKPQHLLDVAAVELVVLVRLRSLRDWLHPTWVAFSLGLVLYFVSVRLLVPTYFTDTVPLLRASYWGFNVPMRQVLRAQRGSAIALTLCVVVYLNLRSRLRLEALEAVFIAAGWGALVAYAQQHKAWTYQMICVGFFTFLAIGTIGTDVLERALRHWGPRARARLQPRVATLLALGVFLAAGASFSLRWKSMAYFETEKQELADIYWAYPPGTPVSFLSASPWEFPAVVEQNKVWASRYFHLWLLPAILRSQNPADDDRKDHMTSAEAERLSTLLRATTADDLAHWRPAVVAVGPCSIGPVCEGLEAQHLKSVLDWFLLDADFRREWAHYGLQKTVNQTQVYTRKD